ncbi:MAG: insulinase family protein [Candidatus Daviesbacteria bacterium]|nr:MAG: insulinase family protein [Candidatus Daviesbacteria bacterium]
MLKTFTLKNGIKVATYNLPQLKSVYLHITVKGGNLLENSQNNGVAHFMEHILVQGIPSYPTAEGLSWFIESCSGRYQAMTHTTSIDFNITVPFNHLEQALQIASQVFFAPLFPEEAIEKERRVVISEINERKDASWYKRAEFFRKVRFQEKHPLTLDGGGSLEVVKNLQRQDLVGFWEKYFTTGNTYLLITGNFLYTNLKKLIKKYLEEVSPKERDNFPDLSNQDFSGRQVAIREDNALQLIYLDLTSPALSLADSLRERVILNLALVIFGRLRNSRLFKLLRYQKGLVYDVSAGANLYPGLGYIYISSQVLYEHLDEVLTIICQEVENFVKFGLTEEELEFARNFLINQWLMSFDHPNNIAGWILQDLFWEKSIQLPEYYISLVKKIKLSDVKKVMKKHWGFGKLNLTLQGPIKNSKENIKKYSRILENLK